MQISRFHSVHSTAQNVVCLASSHGNWKWQQCHTSRSLSDLALRVMATRANSSMLNKAAAKTRSNQTNELPRPRPPASVKLTPAPSPHPTTATSPMRLPLYPCLCSCLRPPLKLQTLNRPPTPSHRPPFRTKTPFAHPCSVSKPRARPALDSSF